MLERFNPDIRHQDNVAWECFREHHLKLYRLAKKFLTGHLPVAGLGKHPVIIDAASGAGYGYDFLEQFGEYLGLDISAEAIFQARVFRPGADYRVCDLESWSDFDWMIHSASVDVIVSFETAEHLADPQKFLHMIASHLEPDGRFLFSAPTCLTRDFDPYHRHDYISEDWKMMLYNAGFEILHNETVGFDCTFKQFLATLPTSLWQKMRIAGFSMIPWNLPYLINRLYYWLWRNEFHWTSEFFICRLESGR